VPSQQSTLEEATQNILELRGMQTALMKLFTPFWIIAGQKEPL